MISTLKFTALPFLGNRQSPDIQPKAEKQNFQILLSVDY